MKLFNSSADNLFNFQCFLTHTNFVRRKLNFNFFNHHWMTIQIPALDHKLWDIAPIDTESLSKSSVCAPWNRDNQSLWGSIALLMIKRLSDHNFLLPQINFHMEYFKPFYCLLHFCILLFPSFSIHCFPYEFYSLTWMIFIPIIIVKNRSLLAFYKLRFKFSCNELARGSVMNLSVT